MASRLHLLTFCCIFLTLRLTLTKACGFDRFYRCDPNSWACSSRGGYCDVRGGKCTCVTQYGYNGGYPGGPAGPYLGGPHPMAYNGYYNNGPYGPRIEPEGNYYARRDPLHERNIEGTGKAMVEMAKVYNMMS